jgi:hypothetical protein
MAFHVDIMYWSPASVARIMKYVAKGFECVVPGVRRSAFKTTTANRSLCRFPPYGSGKGGISELFDAEADVINSRTYWSQPIEELKRKGEMVFTNELIIEKITGRLTLVEAATIASKVLRHMHAINTESVHRDTLCLWLCALCAGRPPPRQRPQQDDGSVNATSARPIWIQRRRGIRE